MSYWGQTSALKLVVVAAIALANVRVARRTEHKRFFIARHLMGVVDERSTRYFVEF